MHLDMKPVYQVQLTADEFSLVTRCLAGVLKPDEKADALKLNYKLCFSRHKRLNECGEISAKALAAADKLSPSNMLEKEADEL